MRMTPRPAEPGARRPPRRGFGEIVVPAAVAGLGGFGTCSLRCQDSLSLNLSAGVSRCVEEVAVGGVRRLL